MEVSGQLYAAAALCTGKEFSGTQIGDWVDPRAGLDAVAKRKICNRAGIRTAVVQSGAWSLC
jgi:hypothetical protein